MELDTTGSPRLSSSDGWCAHVCQSLLCLQEKELLCDLSLEGSDGIVMTHANVIAALSPLVASHVQKQSLVTLELKTWSRKTILEVVKMCYTGPPATMASGDNSQLQGCASALGLDFNDCSISGEDSLNVMTGSVMEMKKELVDIPIVSSSVASKLLAADQEHFSENQSSSGGDPEYKPDLDITDIRQLELMPDDNVGFTVRTNAKRKHAKASVECRKCGKVYTSRKCYKKHIRSKVCHHMNTAKKPHKTIIPTRTSAWRTLKPKHTAEKGPYECKTCGKLYQFKKCYVKHVHAKNCSPPETQADNINKEIGAETNTGKSTQITRQIIVENSDSDTELTTNEEGEHSKADNDDDRDICDVKNNGDVRETPSRKRSFYLKHVNFERDMINLHGLDLKKQTDNRFYCTLCGSSWASSQCLYQHLARLHSITTTFQCRLCDKRLPTYIGGWQHLGDHIIAEEQGQESVTNIKLRWFRCHRCYSSFEKEEVFQTHVVTCTGMTICPVCGVQISKICISKHIKQVSA